MIGKFDEQGRPNYTTFPAPTFPPPTAPRDPRDDLRTFTPSGQFSELTPDMQAALERLAADEQSRRKVETAEKAARREAELQARKDAAKAANKRRGVELKKSYKLFLTSQREALRHAAKVVELTNQQRAEVMPLGGGIDSEVEQMDSVVRILIQVFHERERTGAFKPGILP